MAGIWMDDESRLCQRCDRQGNLQRYLPELRLCEHCTDIYRSLNGFDNDMLHISELTEQVTILEAERARLEDVGEGISLENQSLKYEVSEMQQEIGQLKLALKQVTEERDHLKSSTRIAEGPISIKEIWAGDKLIYEKSDLDKPRDILLIYENDSSPVEEVPVEITTDDKLYIEEQSYAEEETDDDSETPDDTGTVH